MIMSHKIPYLDPQLANTCSSSSVAPAARWIDNSYSLDAASVGFSRRASSGELMIPFSPFLEKHLIQLSAGLFLVTNRSKRCSPQEEGASREVHLLPLPSSANIIHIKNFGAHGILLPGGESALVQVARNGAQLLLCFEQVEDEHKPRIIIRKLASEPEDKMLNDVYQTNAMLAEPDRKDQSLLGFYAHVQGYGDLDGNFGHWIGYPPSQWIEGFLIHPPLGLDPKDLEYQAIIDNSWDTPWFSAGEFCGSRGLEFPIAGFRIRLNGFAKNSYAVTYMGKFMDGEITGPITSQGRCASKTGMPLVALYINLFPKAEADNAEKCV